MELGLSTSLLNNLLRLNPEPLILSIYIRDEVPIY
jgi:hypothetical protein